MSSKFYQMMCLLILQNGQNDQVGDQVYQQEQGGVGGGRGFLVMRNLLSKKNSLC